MKMNNLSNPSRVILSNLARVILSNPARVILSVAKDLAIAASLFAFAACSDYLEDFQDKYDDGKAFAEISSDSDNGGDDGKSSSSSKTGEGISSDKGSSSSNDDSELSSSCKGDVESSDSTGSSSSATNGEEAHCTGTVIYDYKNPGKLGLDLQFFTNGTATKLPENKQGIELTSNTVKDFAIFTLSKNDLHDVSSWEGLCVEYSSNEDIPLYLADSLENIEQINLPANDHFKEISWADTTSRKISLNGRVSFNKFDAFSFEKITTQKVVTISRITTIAKVDTSANSPTLDTTSCTGSIIYDASEAPNYNVFGYGFVIYDPLSEKEASSNGITSNLSQSGSLAMQLATEDKPVNIQSWGGFCVEYSSEGSISADVVSPFVGLEASLIYKEMPSTNGVKSSFRWSWEENEKLVQEQKHEHANGFSTDSVTTISFTGRSKTNSITVSKITTLNSDVHFKCDGSEIFPKGRSTFNAFTIWSSTGPIGRITPSNDKYDITLSGGNSATPDNEVAFKEALAKAHGFCMEYSSDNYFMLSLNQYVEGNKKTNNYAEREVGKGNQRVVFVLWDELKEQFTNFDFPQNHMLELSAPENGVDATNITISRMTLLD